MSNTDIISVEAPKKNVGYRVLAGILLLVCAGLCFLPLLTFVKFWELDSRSLIESIQELLKSDRRSFGFLPVLASGDSYLSLATNLPIYALALVIVISFVLSFIAIFTAKKSPALVRTALLLLTWGTAGYAICIMAISSYLSLALKLDLFLLAAVGVLAILYFVLAAIKAKIHVLMTTLHFVLDLVIFALTLWAITGFHVTKVYNLVFLGIIAVLAINLFVSSCRMTSKKGLVGDLVRYVIQVLVVCGACYMNYLAKINAARYLLLVIVAAVVAIVQVVLVSAQIASRHRKLAAQTKEAVLAEFETEESVEAYAYDGGPVAGVEMAEVIVATPIPAPNTPSVASLLGNGFDPFLIQLTDLEKQQFIDLYVLKCKGDMPEIPGYVVGGDNKDFFNKVFIYLGQYRDKIPDELLARMYQFSMKL